jgi:hypothetical protein
MSARGPQQKVAGGSRPLAGLKTNRAIRRPPVDCRRVGPPRPLSTLQIGACKSNFGQETEFSHLSLTRDSTAPIISAVGESGPAFFRRKFDRRAVVQASLLSARFSLPHLKARVSIAGGSDELHYQCLGRTLEMERVPYPIVCAATSGDADPEPVNRPIHHQKPPLVESTLSSNP